MLLSMKLTTDALQTIGLNVRDADSIMLDMEDVAGDTQALQSALSSCWTDVQLSPEDLEAELELILSDHALCPSAVARGRPPAAAEAPAQPPAPDPAQATQPTPAALEAPLPEVPEPAHLEISTQ
jgi:hypothetical protein